MPRQLFLIIFLLLSLPGISQFTRISTAQLHYSWFNCDTKKNIYTISDGKFLKFTPPYNTSVSFDLEKEGLPSYIDMYNVNKIVLFFQNTGKVILLDSSFNEIIRPFYLEELGLYDISMIFAAQDDGLWFYNNTSNSLTKLNKNFMPVVRALSLDVYFQLPNYPNYITTFEDRIYLNVTSMGVLVLGHNGEYKTAMQLQGMIDFQFDGKVIYFYRDNIIHCYNTKTLKTKKVFVPDEPGIINAWFFDKQIILLFRDGYSVYQHDINPVENY